jgi:prepilin-type N-terminal cleavage/methylation domain-containing protein
MAPFISGRVIRNSQAGFTLVELLVASAISIVVLGGAVAMTAQIQNAYRRQVEDSVAIQEGRYALDWIGRLVRGAGNNPFNRVSTDCPTTGTPFSAIRFDPNGDGIDNDIRLQADSNPPDGAVGGTSGACDQANEDVTVSFDPTNRVITFFDNNLGGSASIRTDQVIDGLRFIYRDSNHAEMSPPVEADAVYVEIQVTVRTRTLDPSTNAPVTRTLTQEIRVRSR